MPEQKTHQRIMLHECAQRIHHSPKAIRKTVVREAPTSLRSLQARDGGKRSSHRAGSLASMGIIEP